jgi:predicted lipoprotein with Yx(FWY)xxD motif
MNRAVFVLSLLAALAIGVAGCGGGDSTTESTGGEESAAADVPPSKSESAADEKPKKGAWGVVFGAEGEPLGLILYDLSGHTLYTFSKDKGGTSTCYGGCAKTWPPALTEGKPRADGEASPAKVGTTKRIDGTVQLTYAGHPLYTYADDGSSETSGNDLHSFGGEWYAIRPSGERP